MIRTLIGLAVNLTGIPRESGDDPNRRNEEVPEEQYSPRERG